jgi:hypothetical protein
MDPLTALSLAGTIIQFVDFGCKLLAEGKELYKSTTGILTVNEELELAVDESWIESWFIFQPSGSRSIFGIGDTLEGLEKLLVESERK